MDWSNWIPAVTIPAVIAGAAWLYRETVGRYLAQAIGGHFAEKLARLTSELHRSEQTLQTELQAKQRQIDALYASVAAARSGRQTLIEKRRLDAIERIWKAAVRISFKSTVPRMLEGVKLEVMLKATGSDREARTRFFKVLDDALGATAFTQSPNQAPTMEERPFVSPVVWAYYSAYNSVVLHAVLLVSAMSRGLEPKYFDFNAIRNVVKEALPHQTNGIDEHGITYCYMCVPELLDALLSALQRELDGKSQDADDLRRATDLMHAVTELNKENAKRADQPSGAASA